MHHRLTTLAAAAVLSFACTISVAQEVNSPRTSATVSFGAGLNTAQPGNKHNHHVQPNRVVIKAGGTVNFIVAGFHQIFAYQPGKTADQVALPAGGLFINDLDRIYYQGIVPAVPGEPGATTNPSNAINRVESVSFAEPGVYLVICNVLPHFIDGMYAYVTVTR